MGVGKGGNLCHNIYMKEKHTPPQEEVIEAEIIDENGLPVTPAQEDARCRAQDSARVHAHVFGGVFALAFSFIMILVMAVVTLFIIFPLMLLGKILGFQVKSFKR